MCPPYHCFYFIPSTCHLPSALLKLHSFQAEFSTLLGDLISSPSELITTSDFNFHVDDPSSCPGSSFLSLLDTFGLSQLVSFPTHTAGHTLDVLISRSFFTLFLISTMPVRLSLTIMPHCLSFCSFAF